jgi:hypothetical protein
MAILRDYCCDQHGMFEAWEPNCPMKFCKGEISVVHLKPVGMKSDKTKSTDKRVKQLGIDFGMTDSKTTGEGEHQAGYLKRNNKLSDKEFAQATEAMEANNRAQAEAAARQPRPGDAVMWGNGGNISMKSVLGGQFKSVNGESVGINPKAAGDLRGPAPASYMADPDNLQVSK